MKSITNTTVMADKRVLSWAEYGAPEGTPLLYLHGSPSSRLEPLAFDLDATASSQGLRIIAPDRPGMGFSTHSPTRTVATTVPDFEHLLDHLKIQQVRILGYSGGGAYAAAVAAMLPDRVANCTLVSCAAHIAPGLDAGLDPRGLSMKSVARDHPRWAKLLLTATMAMPARSPRVMIGMLTQTLPPCRSRQHFFLDDAYLLPGVHSGSLPPRQSWPGPRPRPHDAIVGF